MAIGIPEHVVRQIVRATDFVALASRYCKLVRRGNRFWGLCPFHREKTPSFTIDPERGLFYCFGCKEGGNLFTFLEKMEGLDFGRALEKLAADAGVDLSTYRGQGGLSRGQLDKLREVNELAAAFYRKCLEKGRGGEDARTYIVGRGITAESAAHWRLGLAPEGWEHFFEFARGRGYEPEILEQAGLIISRKDAPGCHDRFRNRLMFPIEDRAGRAIGFGARALKEGDEPKYLNSPETPLFSKGRCLYGVAHAKEAIRTGGAAVLMEGYTDVIMSHQFGVENAVGVLGTAVTEEHARELSRLCERVILVFDADEAGQKSAMRSIEVLLGEDLDIYVARLPAGQDPCDVLLQQGADALRKMLDESEDFLQFRLRVAEAAHDLSTVGGRSGAFREVAELALHCRDEARRDVIVRRVAQELEISGASAWRYIERNLSRRRTWAGADGEPDRPPPASADSRCASELLGFLLAHPEFVAEARKRIDTSLLSESAERTVLGRLLERLGEEGASQREFINSLESEGEVSIALDALVREERVRLQKTGPRERFEGLLSYLEGRKQQEELRSLSPTATKTPVAPGTPTDEQLRAYQRKLEELDRKRRDELT